MRTRIIGMFAALLLLVGGVVLGTSSPAFAATRTVVYGGTACYASLWTDGGIMSTDVYSTQGPCNGHVDIWILNASGASTWHFAAGTSPSGSWHISHSQALSWGYKLCVSYDYGATFGASGMYCQQISF